MNAPNTHHAKPVESSAIPPDSELPAVSAAPLEEEVVPGPGAAGGLDNIPESFLNESEAMTDEMDHAGLDAVLPDEDRAPVPKHD